jgi:hypothetical protein
VDWEQFGEDWLLTENSNDEITLLHSRFANGTIGTCNNGTIVGRDISVDNDTYYTSQLSVTITPDLIGTSIECIHDDYVYVNPAVVGSFTILPITGPGHGTSVIIRVYAHYPIKINITILCIAPPENLHISHIDIGLIQLTFSWSPVDPDQNMHDYPRFDYMYNILASNCGSCPTATNHTYITCTDLPTNGTTCTLAIQTMVCTEDTDCTTGISSDLISIKVLNTRSSHDTREHSPTDHDTMLIASIIFLVASLFTCITVSMMVIVTVLVKERARIKAIFDSFRWKNRTSSTTAHVEGMYELMMSSEILHLLLDSVLSVQHPMLPTVRSKIDGTNCY